MSNQEDLQPLHQILAQEAHYMGDLVVGPETDFSLTEPEDLTSWSIKPNEPEDIQFEPATVISDSSPLPKHASESEDLTWDDLIAQPTRSESSRYTVDYPLSDLPPESRGEGFTESPSGL
jgi:hypothetical protein